MGPPPPGGGTFEGQRLLSAETVSRLHAPRAAWVSIVVLSPSANVGLLVLTNTDENDVPELMKDRLYSLLFPAALAPTAAVAAAAAGSDLVARPSAKARVVPDGVVPPLPLSRYTGSYSNPAFGTITVGEQKGALVVTIGPRKVGLPATHYSGNVFTLALPDYPGWETKATFVVPTGSPASRLRIEKFYSVKDGWFERTGP